MKTALHIGLLLLTLLSGCRRPADSTPEDAGSPPPPPGLRGLVTVKGSDSMVILCQRWAEGFMKLHPDVTIQVTGGGSGTGIAALINGTTDIAMTSRPLQEAEQRQALGRHGQTPAEYAVARDGITFYVHESNPVDTLSLAQLAGIYLGDLRRWSDVGGEDAPIIAYSRESSSGTYAYVKATVLGGQDFTERALTLPGTSAVVDAVSKERHGIGYGGAAWLRRVREVKLRRHEGETPVAPTPESIQDGSYPLARGLSFLLPREPSGATKAFLEYVLSPEGQRQVLQAGFFPVR